MASTTRDLAAIEPLLGRDLLLDYTLGGGFFEDADLASGRPPDTGQGRDLQLAAGLDNLTQAIANRLKTRKGELTALGHPDYGSRHHELIGQPNVDRTRNLIKLYILQALQAEPRIEKVLKVDVFPEHQPPRDTVRVEVQARVIGSETPLNLVLPFSLEAAL